MDKINQLKQELRDQIALAHDEGVVNRLRRLSLSGSELETEVIHTSARFIAVKREYYRNTEALDSIRVESNRIRETILHLINSIDSNNIQWEKPDAHISVVCRAEEPNDKTYLEHFFSVRHHENWQISFALGEPDDLNFDLIVFDNFRANMEMPTEYDKDHLALFKKLMHISVAPLLYCGNFNPDLEAYRDRVNAANSPITLIPRIRESLEFSAYYKGVPKAPWNRHSF